MMYDPATGIIVCILTNQLPAQAFQISVQMLTTVWNSTVSIAESEDTESMLYPNPSNDMVTISSDHAIQSIKIYDIHGKLVMESTESTFSITQLPTGTYHVRAHTIGEVRNYSLIKH
jgi:ketopantoate hydroxymethyltransferase